VLVSTAALCLQYIQSTQPALHCHPAYPAPPSLLVSHPSAMDKMMSDEKIQSIFCTEPEHAAPITSQVLA
jgi:hypothetical protein